MQSSFGRGINDFIPSEYMDSHYHNKGRLEVEGNIADLYFMAYMGIPYAMFDIKRDSLLINNFWPKPIIEVNNPELLQAQRNKDEDFYGYSLVVPRDRAKKEFMMHVMQNDLKNYFGYSVAIENRVMPYWRLVASAEARNKLSTKDNKVTKNYYGRGYEGGKFTNISMNDFFLCLYGSAKIWYNDIPILLNETGITGNIDIDVEWAAADLESIKRAVNKYGLDIEKTQKMMKCIVIHSSSN